MTLLCEESSDKDNLKREENKYVNTKVNRGMSGNFEFGWGASAYIFQLKKQQSSNEPG